MVDGGSTLMDPRRCQCGSTKAPKMVGCFHREGGLLTCVPVAPIIPEGPGGPLGPIEPVLPGMPCRVSRSGSFRQNLDDTNLRSFIEGTRVNDSLLSRSEGPQNAYLSVPMREALVISKQWSLNQKVNMNIL